jgi:glutamyl-Q tRNA(Asp) synthetase
MEWALARHGSLAWEDERRGLQLADPLPFGDVVLWRKDAPASYHLAATLDDAADGVSVVTRGVDLFRASHVHRLLQALLGLPVPRWHHHGVLVGPDGRKLAKRRGAAGLDASGALILQGGITAGCFAILPFATAAVLRINLR